MQNHEEMDNHEELWVLNIRHGLEIKSMKPNLLNYGLLIWICCKSWNHHMQIAMEGRRPITLNKYDVPVNKGNAILGLSGEHREKILLILCKVMVSFHLEHCAPQSFIFRKEEFIWAEQEKVLGGCARMLLKKADKAGIV